MIGSRFAIALAIFATAPLTTGSLGAAAPMVSKPIAAAVADKARPDSDTARDVDRKPGELMAFAGVKPGMKIVELAPGGGYFTRLLSLAVGAKGKVIAYSPRPSPAVDAWAANHPNTTMTTGAGAATMQLASEPVDLVWTTLNYHDFKNSVTDGRDAAAKFNDAAFAALKPGGSYLIVDHEAAAGAGTTVTATLHRIESAAVIKEVEGAGFKLAAQSDLLRHAADDHTKAMRDSDRGKTDQFVLRFVKPKAK